MDDKEFQKLADTTREDTARAVMIARGYPHMVKDAAALQRTLKATDVVVAQKQAIAETIRPHVEILANQVVDALLTENPAPKSE